MSEPRVSDERLAADIATLENELGQPMELPIDDRLFAQRVRQRNRLQELLDLRDARAEITRLREALAGVQSGNCWCGVGIDDPNYNLRALAQRATPGPWHACFDEDGVTTVAPGADCASGESFIASMGNGAADGAYVAAANPAALLELCREMDDLKAKLEAAERERDAANEHCNNVTQDLGREMDTRLLIEDERDAAIQRAEQAGAKVEKLRGAVDEAIRSGYSPVSKKIACPVCGLHPDEHNSASDEECILAAVMRSTAPEPPETPKHDEMCELREAGCSCQWRREQATAWKDGCSHCGRATVEHDSSFCELPHCRACRGVGSCGATQCGQPSDMVRTLPLEDPPEEMK